MHCDDDPDFACIAKQPVDCGGFTVMATRHEVMWRNGSTVKLHPVRRNNLRLHSHRAIELADGGLLLVDLARLVASLTDTLRNAAQRDVPGLVFYSLRLGFANAALFLQAAQRHAFGVWRPNMAGRFVWYAPTKRVLADDATMPAADEADAEVQP